MKHSLPLALLLFSLNAHGTLNKWTDAAGHVHYSDEPPPGGANAAALEVPRADSSVPPQKTFIEREAERKKEQKARDDAERQAAQRQAGEQARRDGCNALRANLAALKNAPGILMYNALGEEVALDADGRRQQLEETQRRIEAECGR